MKRVSMLLVFVCVLLVMSVAGANPIPGTGAAAKQVVIIPFINSTEETKGYIAETVNEKFKEQFSNVKYQTITNDTVTAVISNSGFDASNKEMPENDLLIKLAKETDADYVVAMEIMHFMNSRHAAFLSQSTKSEVKLRYKVYSKISNKVTTFQVTGKGNNKDTTGYGFPGFGTAMKRGLALAMDEGYLKIEKL